MSAASTLLVCLPTGHNLANVLHSAVLSTLLDQETRYRVVLLSPLAQDTAIKVEVEQTGALLEPLHPYQPGRMERLVDSIASEQFLRATRLTAVRLQRDRARLMRTRRPHPLLLAAKTAVCRLPIHRSTWYALGQRANQTRPYRRLFDRLQPELVATSTGGFVLSEVPLIYEARRRGVPVVAIDLGWDNLSSKYHTIQPVDQLAVWNELMRAEAERYHGYTPEQVHITGTPQFDAYFKRRDLPTRDEFMASIGADPNRRLVTLATTAAGTYGSTHRIVELLANAIAADQLGPAAQLLVRLHPRDRMEHYAPVANRRFVLIERSGEVRRAVDGISELDAVYPSRADRAHLAATLAHSDVVINFASTTTIEACIFDTPVVNIGFDDREGLPLPLSIRRYFAYEHYRPVLETQAARVAASPAELIAGVKSYLEQPTLDRDGRAALVRIMCGFTDGRSAKRVAESMLSLTRKAPALSRAALPHPY
jgi:CDP-glycerol glycerophosphotransferase (TagB/SpsB family)